MTDSPWRVQPPGRRACDSGQSSSERGERMARGQEGRTCFLGASWETWPPGSLLRARKYLECTPRAHSLFQAHVSLYLLRGLEVSESQTHHRRVPSCTRETVPEAACLGPCHLPWSALSADAQCLGCSWKPGATAGPLGVQPQLPTSVTAQPWYQPILQSEQTKTSSQRGLRRTWNRNKTQGS